eukprot:c12212_g1_i1 orf=546-1472(+)
MAMTEVFLHVYDVANSESVKTNNAILQLNKIFKDGIGLGGIFHSAIEVYGKQEWSFGFCESGTGVFNCRRTENPMYIYRESLSLGHTPLSPSSVREVLNELKQEWKGSDYDLLARNCNHFCNEFCTKLKVQKLPGWVNRFANAGETAVEVAETTMKRLRQAKTEVVSASKVAYRVLFGGASASTVSPDPGGHVEGSSSNGGGNVLRLPFMKTPVSLFSRIGLGSASQSMNERTQGDQSTGSGKESVHDSQSMNDSMQGDQSTGSGKESVHDSQSMNDSMQGDQSTGSGKESVHAHNGGIQKAPEQPPP